ncbi:MAG: galactokinase [Phycisphaerae bacterium]|nr:MAG: galactokinase [Phycisphaerae bacterium]
MTGLMPQPHALERAVHAYQSNFGVKPTCVALAPGRVNLIGEHIDYAGGAVLPMAIDLACAVAAGPGRGDVGRIVATDLSASWTYSRSDRFTAMRADARDGGGDWRSYVAGVLHGVGERAGGVPAVDVCIASDVPRGSGLSSSAALEVALAAVACEIAGVEWAADRPWLARLCQRAEWEFAGVPCGLMDQAASCLGREGHAMLMAFREGLDASWVPMPRGIDVLVFDSGVPRALGAGAYGRLRAASDSAAMNLGLTYLCDAPAGVEPTGLDDGERRAAIHAIGENRRVIEAAEALRAGEHSRVGVLLNESHASLRDVLRVSCDELDTLVDFAGVCPGVYGARLTGAGFGGCAIALAAADCAEHVAESVSAAFERRYGRRCRSWRVRASEGVRVSRWGCA